MNCGSRHRRRSLRGLAAHLSDPRREAGRRGAALVIALFSLLTITGMGLIAVSSATEEIQSSGNYRFNKQAEQTSAGALDTAIGEVTLNGPAYWQVMQQNARATATAGTVNETTIDRAYTFDDTFLNAMFFVGPTGDATTLAPNLTVTMDSPVDGFAVPGFSADYCFKRFEFNSTGTIGTLPTDLTKLDPKARYSQYNHRSFGILGPIHCEGN